jgi:hypothetical protein
MNEKQALEVVKAALDLGVKNGNFANLNEAYAIIQAFDVLSKHINTKDSETIYATN